MKKLLKAFLISILGFLFIGGFTRAMVELSFISEFAFFFIMFLFCMIIVYFTLEDNK